MAMSQWGAGQRITAGRLALMTPVWASWIPTWSTATGLHLPSLGNAAVDCMYAQSGNLVSVSFDLAFGSTTTFGRARPARITGRSACRSRAATPAGTPWVS
jgi:hypothetical protein